MMRSFMWCSGVYVVWRALLSEAAVVKYENAILI